MHTKFAKLPAFTLASWFIVLCMHDCASEYAQLPELIICDAGQQLVHAAGPKGEGGLDDATGAGGAGGASMKQSSGVVDLGKHQMPPTSRHPVLACTCFG